MKQFEKWAKGIIKEYQEKLLITQHDINLVSKTEKNQSLMEMTFRLPYLDPNLNYNPNKVSEYWKRGERDELKHALIHELCHVITDPLYGCATDRWATKDEIERTRETLTDHIAMIVKKNML